MNNFLPLGVIEKSLVFEPIVPEIPIRPIPQQVKLDRFRLIEVAPDFYQIQDRCFTNPLLEIAPDGHGMPADRLEKARQLTALLNEFFQ